MDIKQMKENLLVPGEEGVFSSKVLPSTPRQPTVTMATPRKPLMDLSQVPRPSQDDLKASVTKLKNCTPLLTPQSKKSKRFPQSSSLVYQDKEQDNSRKQSDQVVKDALTDTDEVAEALDHNELNQSIDNGDLDNFITSVLNKCVIDIQNNNLDDNYTNSSYVEIDTSINTLETGQYHADCVNYEVKTIQTDERVQPTEADELNFSDRESYEDHTYCVKTDECSEIKEYFKNEKMSSDHNYFAKGSIISPLSNDNINNEITNAGKSDHTYCTGQSNVYVPVETNLVNSGAQGLEDIVHSDVGTLVKDGVCSSENLIVATPEKPVCQVSDDYEFDQKTGFTNGGTDTNEDLFENIETDSVCVCENSTSEWIEDNPVCLSQNSSLISDTLNPQGVTYIKSLNADSETGGSPWKQTVTSPTCTMNYQDQSVFDQICVSAEESQHKPLLDSPLVNEKLEVCSEYVLNVDSYLMEESFDDRDNTIIMGDSVNNLVKTPLAPPFSEFLLSKDLSSVTSDLTNSEIKKEISFSRDTANSEIDGVTVATDSTENNVHINCINESVSESPVVVDQTYLYSEYVMSTDSYLGEVSPEDQKISSELILNTKTEDVSAGRESTLPKIVYSPTLEPSNTPVASHLGETVEDSTCLKEHSFLKVMPDSCTKEIGSVKSSPLAESPSQIEKSSLCSDYVLHVDSYIVDELTCEVDRCTTPVSERLEDTADSTLIDSTLTNTTMPSPDHANVIDTLSETVSEFNQNSSQKDCINTSMCINPSVHASSSSVLETMDSTIEEDKSLDTIMECHNKAVSMNTVDKKSTIEEDKSLDTIMECHNKAVSMNTVDRKSSIEEDKSLDTIMECHNKAVSMNTVDKKATIDEDKSLDTIMECRNKAISMDTVYRKSATCSPMPLSMCDVSVQNIPDTHSAMNSPFIVNEIKNTSVNTDVTDTDDANVGTETPATIYVNIIKDQTEVVDKGSITDKTVMSEMWTNTDNHERVSVGVEVRPELETVYTEMVDLPMLTVGTSMTPVKLANKFGKRLTAEDIRRQHPRAVANQLETLKLQNEHLEAQVRSLEHEREKLKTSVKDSKASLRKAEKHITDVESAQDQERNKIWEMTNHSEDLEKALREQTQTHDSEIEELNGRLAEIEQEKSVMKKEYADEIENMKKKYEENNYHDHFLASQKLVRQLQLELSQYTQLLDDIEQSHKIQENLEEKMSAGVVKIKLAGETILSLHRTLNAREQTLSAQQSDLDRQGITLTEELAKIQTEREVMQAKLEEDEAKLRAERDQMQEMLKEEQGKITAEREQMEVAVKEDEARIKSERDQMLISVNEERARVAAEREQMLASVKEEETRVKSEREQMLESIKEEEVRIKSERDQMQESVKEEEMRIKSEREQMLVSISEEETRIKTEREQMLASVTEEETRVKSEREQMQKVMKEEEARVRAEREQMKKELGEEKTKLRKGYEQMEYSLMTRVTTEREEMQKIVKCCKVEMEELDDLYQRTCKDLEAANTKTTSLLADFEDLKAELTSRGEEKNVLENRVEELRQIQGKYELEIETLQATLKHSEELAGDTNNRLSECQDLLHKEREDSKKAIERLNMEKINLQRTLDSREQDIDVLEKDVFECREIIYSQMEKLRLAEEKEKSTEAELKSREVENMELRGCCAALRGKEQELLENLRFTKEELLGTRDHASRMLKEQGTEMANCSAVIGELTDHMTTVLSGLNKKAGIQKTPSKAAVEEIIVKPHDPNVALDLSKPPHVAAQSQSSLVSQILSAAMSHDNKNLNGEVPVKTQNEAETDLPVNQSEKNDKESITVGDVKEHSLDINSGKIDSPGTISRKNLGFSGSSAFAPVRSGVLSERAKSSVTSHSSSATGQTVQQTDTKSTEVVKEADSLPDQVNKALEVFTEINRLISLIEKASRSALQDMRSENNELNSRLSQCEFTERRLQADLDYHRTELEMSKGLCVELREKLEEMGDRLGQYLEQESEIKRLQQEMGHLHGKIQSLEAEKEFQNDQMKELLERLEQSSDATQPSGLDVNSQKEILTLQKKVHKLREQLQEKHDLIEEISNKASRRIQKLEDNWKKADKEVLRFDELVDTVRHSLVKNEALMKEEDIRKVVRLIDGQEQVSSFKKGGQLKPIKTSTW